MVNLHCNTPAFGLVIWIKKHDIKTFKVLKFVSLTFIGPMYIAKIGAYIVIESQTPRLPYWIK